MEFGPAVGRSISPSQGSHTNQEEGVEEVGCNNQEEGVEKVGCKRGFGQLSSSVGVHGLQFPTVPRPSRSNTPMCYQSSDVSVSPRVPTQASPSHSSTHRGVVKLNEPRVSVPKPCYLCLFADEPICVHYTQYIMAETARTSRPHIAKMVADDICQHETRAGRSPDGVSAVDVERHIALHMLHPGIKVPEIIRELDDVRRLMRGSITNTCPDTGSAVIDTGNVALYLRVVREMQQVYKMGDYAKLSMGGGVLAGATIASEH